MRQAPILNPQQQRRVLAHVAGTSYAARNRAMLLLSWWAGMRVGEIAALNTGDVVAGDGTIRDVLHLRATQTKGSSGRSVYLNAGMREELARYVATRQRMTTNAAAADPLFVSRSGRRFSANGLCIRFCTLYDAAGVDAATSHSGRRTFITGLANRGVSVRVLAALAGHRHIATTQRYIDINEGMIKQAVELV
jgi:integrase/recombinase XerD